MRAFVNLNGAAPHTPERTASVSVCARTCAHTCCADGHQRLFLFLRPPDAPYPPHASLSLSLTVRVLVRTQTLLLERERGNPAYAFLTDHHVRAPMPSPH
jgi:hypothetical protein